MITIHTIKSEELPEVRKLLSQTWNDTYGTFLSEETIGQITNSWHSLEKLQEQTNNPYIYFALAKNDHEKIVGLTTAKQLDDGTISLDRLYIDPQQQRQGIGSRLLQSVLHAFPNAKKIKLEVEERNNKGLSFYRKLGFYEIEKKIVAINKEHLSIIVMEKLIKIGEKANYKLEVKSVI